MKPVFCHSQNFQPFRLFSFLAFFSFFPENVQLLILQISGPLCRNLRLHIFYLTILHCLHLMWSSYESPMRHVVDDTARKENNTVWLHKCSQYCLDWGQWPFQCIIIQENRKGFCWDTPSSVLLVSVRRPNQVSILFVFDSDLLVLSMVEILWRLNSFTKCYSVKRAIM